MQSQIPHRPAVAPPPDRTAPRAPADAAGIWRRHVWFIVSLLLASGVFGSVLFRLAQLCVRDERYSYILFVPAVSALLLWWERRAIFATIANGRKVGSLLLVCAAASYGLSFQDPGQSLGVLAAVFTWAAIFVFCYGPAALRASVFPWGFLLLMVPLPAVVLDGIVAALQRGSAEIAFWLFKAIGLPVLRHDLIFALPGVNIEISRECSGIRSSMSLIIASMVAGRIFLGSPWRRVCLAVATIPVVIFKNAVRIASISWLGIHVSGEFFYGTLHHQYGGLVFSVLSLVLQLSLLILLQHSEKRAILNRRS
jgi:exosortase